MNQGNITFTGIYTVPDTVQGANNGLSLNALTSFVVLGQNVGEAGNPGLMVTSREIPYVGGTTLRISNLTFANTNILMGGQFGGRISLGINGRTGAVPTLLLNNDSNTTYKQWFFESSPQVDPAGMLQLNDQTGLFFIMNRQLASLSAPFHTSKPVLNTAVNFPIILSATRPRFTFTNTGAAGNIIFTLPPIAANTPRWPEFTFVDMVGTTITIQAPGGVTIRIGAVISPAGGTVTNTAQGDSVRLHAVSLTEWVAIAVVGAWVTP